MTALAPRDREHLARLFGLLGSDFAGEMDAAGLAASRFIKQLGVTWHDLRGTADDTWQSGPRVPDDDHDVAVLGRWPGGWRSLASDRTRSGPGILTDWELGFCANCRTLRNLSWKQAAILRPLSDKLVLEGAFVWAPA